MIDKEALRTQALTQSQPIGTKQRFGLFSHPISTAIGDDGPYKSKHHPKNEQGKPITQQRNFQTSLPHSGQLKTSYFTPLNSLATHTIRDVYIDEGRRLLREQNDNFKKGQRQQIFIPGRLQKTLATPSYSYSQQKPSQLNPKRNRGEDGRVKVAPTNFYTNPGSKVIHTSFKPIQYIEDPYERARDQQVQNDKKNKNLQGQVAFKPNCFVAKVLTKPIKIYGEDVQLKPKQSRQTKFNIYKHDTEWRPSNPNKSGLYGYFKPFPKYMENPSKTLGRKTSVQGQKQSFKLMNASLTSPSPSISQNPINLRSYLSHSFHHRF